MSMERCVTWGWKFILPLFFSLLYSVLSSDFPSQGCYWTKTCLHKLKGDCGGLVYNQSSDCYGHCQGPKASPCPPGHAHFYCCVAGSPNKVKDGCKKCENKMDYGNEFVCCSDCTYPEMIYGDTSSGYCISGAELISEPKPKEVFEWVAGPWLPCSSPCGGGLRSRRVECFSVVEETSIVDYPVYDDRCSNQEKPAAQEPCNLQSCIENMVVNHRAPDQRHGRKSAWVVTSVVVIVAIVVGAVGYAGYVFYRRRTESQYGYVYIMMEGIS